MTEGHDITRMDPEIDGVSLGRYAAVLAYAGRGVDLRDALDHVDVDLDAWPAVDEAWSLRLAESASGDGVLLAACDAHRARADEHVVRPLPPLDTDLRAWLDFFRAFSAEEAPLAFCNARGLVIGDVFRLLARWHAAMDGDDELRASAGEILAGPGGPVPDVIALPPSLEPSTRWPRSPASKTRIVIPLDPDTTMDGVSVTASSAMPFVPASGAPPLPSSSPPPPAPRGLGDTAPDHGAPGAPVLPFRAPAAAWEASPGSYRARLSLEEHAAMHAEIEHDRSLALTIIARYLLTPELKRMEDAAWHARLSADTDQRWRWLNANHRAAVSLRAAAPRAGFST